MRFQNGALANTTHGHTDFPSGCLSCLLGFWNRGESLTFSPPQTCNHEWMISGGVCSFLEMAGVRPLRLWRKNEEVEMAVITLKRLCVVANVELTSTQQALTEHLLYTEHWMGEGDGNTGMSNMGPDFRGMPTNNGYRKAGTQT